MGTEYSVLVAASTISKLLVAVTAALRGAEGCTGFADQSAGPRLAHATMPTWISAEPVNSPRDSVIHQPQRHGWTLRNGAPSVFEEFNT